MTLSTNQLAFLAKRIEPGILTDKQAALELKFKPKTVYTWKRRSPEFKQACKRLNEDLVEFAVQANKGLAGLSYRARYNALVSRDKRLALDAAKDTDDRWGRPKTQEVGVHWSPEISRLMDEYEAKEEE